jgi:hypothetical protein
LLIAMLTVLTPVTCSLKRALTPGVRATPLEFAGGARDVIVGGVVSCAAEKVAV